MSRWIKQPTALSRGWTRPHGLHGQQSGIAGGCSVTSDHPPTPRGWLEARGPLKTVTPRNPPRASSWCYSKMGWVVVPGRRDSGVSHVSAARLANDARGGSQRHSRSASAVTVGAVRGMATMWPPTSQDRRAALGAGGIKLRSVRQDQLNGQGDKRSWLPIYLHIDISPLAIHTYPLLVSTLAVAGVSAVTLDFPPSFSSSAPGRALGNLVIQHFAFYFGCFLALTRCPQEDKTPGLERISRGRPRQALAAAATTPGRQLLPRGPRLR